MRRLGVAARFLPTGETVFYRADDLFPTASVIKVAIVTELFLREAEGRLDTRTPVTVADDALVGGSGVLAHLTLPGGGKIGVYQPKHPRADKG